MTIIVRSLCEWLLLSFFMCTYNEETPLIMFMWRNHMGIFFKYWEVISVHHWDCCLHRKHHVPLKKIADVCTVGHHLNWIRYMSSLTWNVIVTNYSRKKRSAWIKHRWWRHNMTSQSALYILYHRKDTILMITKTRKPWRCVKPMGR